MDGRPELFGASAYDSDSSVEETLVRFDPYIVALAQRTVSRSRIRPEVLDLEIDEVAQNARIKFWHALKEKQIERPRAYLRRIVHNEFINLLRSQSPCLPLPFDNDGEIDQSQVSGILSEGVEDPEAVFEQQTAQTELLAGVVEAVLVLPRRQQQAMICSLLERVDDLILLVDVFKERQVDIEQARWPEEKADEQRLKGSLSPARQKIARHIEKQGYRYEL